MTNLVWSQNTKQGLARLVLGWEEAEVTAFTSEDRKGPKAENVL